jgi:uncharacterized membrane protein HdeD (DUF308 family)
MFRMYSNFASSMTRRAAAGVLIIGMLLIGFGVLILAFPEVFAMLAAIVFFIIGLSVVGAAVRMYLGARRISRPDWPDEGYRGPDRPDRGPGPRIHELDDFEQ